MLFLSDHFHVPLIWKPKRKHLVRTGQCVIFFSSTEIDDEDKSCFVDLTGEQFQKIVSLCTLGTGQNSNSFGTALFRPKHNSTEWLCEQKRPIDGLYKILEKYKSGQTTIPDYLVLINDDTYLNMEALVKTFREYYPPGTLVNDWWHLVNPIAGMGTIFTNATIAKIIKPIHCQNDDQSTDPFVKWTCWRLKRNLVGEARFFRDGMSIGDLMKSYTKGMPFTKVDEWNETSYCFHGEHAIGYFFNFYHVSAPDWILEEATPTERIRKLFSFKKLADNLEESHKGRGGECDNTFEKCTTNSRICHSVDAEQMIKIYEEQQSSITN